MIPGCRIPGGRVPGRRVPGGGAIPGGRRAGDVGGRGRPGCRRSSTQWRRSASRPRRSSRPARRSADGCAPAHSFAALSHAAAASSSLCAQSLYAGFGAGPTGAGWPFFGFGAGGGGVSDAFRHDTCAAASLFAAIEPVVLDLVVAERVQEVVRVLAGVSPVRPVVAAVRVDPGARRRSRRRSRSSAPASLPWTARSDCVRIHLIWSGDRFFLQLEDQRGRACHLRGGERGAADLHVVVLARADRDGRRGADCAIVELPGIGPTMWRPGATISGFEKPSGVVP